jgi:hypothetical protein
MLVAVMMRLHRVAICFDFAGCCTLKAIQIRQMALTMQRCCVVAHPPVVSATDSRALKRDTSW